jgi:hypothetical protein
MTATTSAASPDRSPQDRGDEARPRSLRSDLEWLRSQLTSAVEAQPFAAVAAAAGIGFVLGGGLTRPTIGLLIETGSRVAANRLGEVMRSHDAEPEESRA